MKTNSVDWSMLMPVTPDGGTRPRQLYAAIRRMIETGTVPPGSKLPTTRDLARRFGLSRTSAVAAFDMLVADGFAEARIGSGTFVAMQVPRLELVPSSTPMTAEREAYGVLPGDPGVATADMRTMRELRSLISKSLIQVGDRHFHYADPRGSERLRQAIASYLRIARGVCCDAGQVMITSGVRQGIDLTARSLLKPGDAVWIEDPCYNSARIVLEMAGGRVVGVPVDHEGLDVEQGECIHAQARLAYVTPSHQYPLGVTMTMRRRLALLDWAKRHDAWIIEDDYDSEFRFAGPPLMAMQGMDGSGRVIYLGTFAKVLFPGIRVGYAVLPHALLDRIMHLRTHIDRQPPTLLENALADFIDKGYFAAHLRRSCRRARIARDVFVQALQDCCVDLDVALPDQGLHFVVGLQGDKQDAEIVRLLRQAGTGGRALSAMYVDAQPRQGLIFGFSGFDAAALVQAGQSVGRVMQSVADVRIMAG